MTTKWLELATRKDPMRPQYATVHGNVAADGYRAHRDNSLPPVEGDEFVDRLNDCGIIPSRPRNRATVSRVDLVTACKLAYALRDEWDRKNKNYPDISFSMNGSFTYSAEVPSVGKIAGEIVDGLKVTDRQKWYNGKGSNSTLKVWSHRMTYRHHNPDRCVDFKLSAKYLMDALEGMEGDTVEIDIPARNAPFYLTDGAREAVIMPICS